MQHAGSINIAPFVLWLTAGIGVVGLVLIVFAAARLPAESIRRDIVRDLGIAFLVAAIVSVAYELNTRSLLDVERLEGVLQTVLASNVPPKVWHQVNDEILQRHVIRRNVQFRLAVRSDPTLSPGQRVLKVAIEYDLHGLSSSNSKYTLSNELGSLNLQNVAKTLPRFESVTVGNKVYEGADLAKISAAGKFTVNDIDVNPVSEQPVHIEVVRSEVIYLPGNYDIAMSELTDGIRLHIDGGDEFKGAVKIWSDKGDAQLSAAGDMWNFDGVMFPGQEVTVRFTKK